MKMWYHGSIALIYLRQAFLPVVDQTGLLCGIAIKILVKL